MKTIMRNWALLFVGMLIITGCVSSVREIPVAATNNAATTQHVTLSTAAGEEFEVSVFVGTSDPRAAILFSHGGGSWPEQYRVLIDLLTAEGFVVLAPTHADSVKRTIPIAFNRPEAFQARILELQATAAYAKTSFDLPLGVIGHSYGSLFAAMAGGALENIAPGRISGVDAVVAFSTPGVIPGLITPGTYRTLDVPYMLLTGDNDRVPGFVTDPTDHLVAFEEATGSSLFAVITANGDHELVGSNTPDAVFARQLAVSFLKAELLDDAAAMADLAQTPPKDVQVRRRKN